MIKVPSLTQLTSVLLLEQELTWRSVITATSKKLHTPNFPIPMGTAVTVKIISIRLLCLRVKRMETTFCSKSGKFGK